MKKVTGASVIFNRCVGKGCHSPSKINKILSESSITMAIAFKNSFVDMEDFDNPV